MPETPTKLLIVDDEKAIRTSLSQIFEQMGHSVSTAEDGFSALQQIRDATPDVLLSDLNMPGMSGFELLSVVRRRLPGIYVIATSGAYSGENVPHGIAADAFYEKATNFRSLAALVKTASRASGTKARESPPSTPMWISRICNEASGEVCVMITCPECLRAFPHGVSSSDLQIAEANCIYCNTPIHYATVQPLDPATSQPFAKTRPATRMVPQHVVELFGDGETAADGGERTYA